MWKFTSTSEFFFEGAKFTLVCNMGVNSSLWEWNFYLREWFFTHRNKFITCKFKFLHQPEFSPAGSIFTLRPQFFTMVIDSWPPIKRYMVTNNLTTVIETMLSETALIEALHSCIYNLFCFSELQWILFIYY